LESDAIGGMKRWRYTQLIDDWEKVGQGPAPTMEWRAFLLCRRAASQLADACSVLGISRSSHMCILYYWIPTSFDFVPRACMRGNPWRAPPSLSLKGCIHILLSPSYAVLFSQIKFAVQISSRYFSLRINLSYKLLALMLHFANITCRISSNKPTLAHLCACWLEKNI
jgi:hypothetical protein